MDKRTEFGILNESGVARGVLAVVLAWGSITKLHAPDDFGVVVWSLSHQHLSPPMAVCLGISLAWFEVVLASMLRFGERQRTWLAATGALLTGFILVLVRLMTMPDAPSCGCLVAPGLRAHPFEHAFGIVRNIALLWICWIAWRSVENEHAEPAVAPA